MVRQISKISLGLMVGMLVSAAEAHTGVSSAFGISHPLGGITHILALGAAMAAAGVVILRGYL